MKFCLSSVLFMFVAVFALGTVPVDEASAQGPIIKRMRDRLNGGKPLLPFVEDDSDSSKKSKKKPTPAGKEPTPAKKKDTDRKPTKSKARKPSPQREAAKGFGMELQKVGKAFVIAKIDSRGNAAEAGLKRGDVIEEVGGAPITVIEEFEAIADAMGGGDRVEFSVSRRGSKPETVAVQFGEPEPVDEEEKPAKFDVAPAKKSGSVTKRSFTDRYEPPVGSGLKSVYENATKPSSVLKPSPAPTPAGIKPLELDLPALDGGK